MEYCAKRVTRLIRLGERILGLTRLQKRVLIYIINRDIKNLKDNYNILTKNCSSYIATVLNKAMGKEVINSNLIGIHTPMNTYKSITPFLSEDMPVAEGYLTKLKRVLPMREARIKMLKRNKFFNNVDFRSLENPMKNPEATVNALKDFPNLTKIHRAEISEELKKDLRSFIYSYTIERSPFIQDEASQVYRELYKNLNTK